MKNFMKAITMAIVLLVAMTSCRLYDTAGQRAQLMENLHDRYDKT